MKNPQSLKYSHLHNSSHWFGIRDLTPFLRQFSRRKIAWKDTRRGFEEMNEEELLDVALESVKNLHCELRRIEHLIEEYQKRRNWNK